MALTEAELQDSIARVAHWVEKRGYRGYEPADGNASPLHALTFGSTYLQRILQQVVLRETELGFFHGPPNGRWPQCRGLGEGETVTYGGLTITAFSTPGHADAHNCYLVRSVAQPQAPAVLISGDLIFAGSLGGGYFCCQRQLTHSRRVLGLLADNTVLAPGHGPLTTAANERRFNPFLSA